MAIEKIDVKAEAERIINEFMAERYVMLSEHVAMMEIVRLCKRVHAEAAREQMEMDCKAVRDKCTVCDNGVYEVDERGDAVECEYCGRPMAAISAAFAEPCKEQEPPTQRDLAAMLDAELEAPEPEPRNIGKEIIADLKELNLRQFVDAAVRLAEAHMEYPASGHPDDMADTETILRLAPQFKEQET